MSEEKKRITKTRQALVDRVLSRLDAGAMPWDNGMSGFAAPRNAVTGKAYRGLNLFALMCANKSDPRWMTFNQAKDNGYTVKKGAKGTPIELYKTIDKRTNREWNEAAVMEEMKGMSSEERRKFKHENFYGFTKDFYVFNAEDIHGIEPYVAPPVDVTKRNERIERIIAASEAPITYDGNGRNYYDPIPDEIHLTERAAFKSDEFFYNTALHEMAHSTGHSSRLNRPGGHFGSKEYAREELVAEIASVLTASELGLDHSDRVIENSAEYVRSWAQLIRDNPQTLIDATFDASHATDYICGKEQQAEKTSEEKAQKENTQPSKSQPYDRYMAVQEKHPDAVVVMRLGDFYEVMGEKAKTVADELDLTLTTRNVGKPERVPMCGFPYHVAARYLEKILDKHNVAVIENDGEEKLILSHVEAQKTPLESLAVEKTQKGLTDEEYRIIATIAGNTTERQKTVNIEWVALASTESEEAVIKIAEKYGSTITDGEMSIPVEMRQAYNAEWTRRQEQEQMKAQKEMPYDEFKTVSAIVLNGGQEFKQISVEWASEALGKSRDEIVRIGEKYGAALDTVEYDGKSAEILRIPERFIVDYATERERRLESGEWISDETMTSGVKEWYTRTYPTDELGKEISAVATFAGVQAARRLSSNEQVYDYLGVDDAVMYERITSKLLDVAEQDTVMKEQFFSAWKATPEIEKAAVKDELLHMERMDFIDDDTHGRERLSWVREYEAMQEKIQKESEAAPRAPQQQHTKPLVVNFYGGPSCGKTTAALELTAALKKAGYNVEYVGEFAKQLVLEGKTELLKNQQYVTDGQYKLLDRIRNSADVIVTDSPVLLGLVYGKHNGISDEYSKKIRSYYDSFDNFNMLVERPKDAAFQTEGRVHDERQSVQLDGEIKDMLGAQKVFYGDYKRDDIAKTVERIGTTYNRLYGSGEKKKQKESGQSEIPPPPKKTNEFKTNLDNIPDEMKALPNWIAFRAHWEWKKEEKKYIFKKDPITPNQPHGVSDSKYLKWAHSDDPTTWATFDKAVAFAKKYKLDGLSFAMNGSGMTCIDLDHHLDENGKPSELAQKFLDAAKDTYVEKSVSGRGLHIFYTGARPADRPNRNISLDLEVYDSGRFMSMTGDIYGDTTSMLKPISPELMDLLKANLKEQPKIVPRKFDRATASVSDVELIDRISKSRRGSDFNALMRGELLVKRPDGSGDPSGSDYMLCNMLAFFSGGDVAQVERIIKSSGLYRPTKPDKYYAMTARNACDKLQATYDPSYGKRRNGDKPNSKGKPSGSGKSGLGAGR